MAVWGLAHVGLEGRFLRVNRRLCEFFGYSESGLVGMLVKALSHPAARDLADASRSKVLAGELDSARLEKRYLHKDGGVVWASIAIAMERDASGQPLYAISVIDDVTARREADSALRESAERYRGTFDLADSGVSHLSLHHHIYHTH